jgi:multisubunit Na+/H+ antiporter MnhE subunit
MTGNISRRQSAQAGGVLKSAVGRVATFAVMYFTYVLFVAPPDKAEMIIGTVLAAAASAAISIFRAGEKIRFCPSPRHVLQAWHMPGLALEGAQLLAKALFQQLLGIRKAGSFIRAVPFSAVGADCRSSARAALAELYTTMTPNSIVLGIAHKQRLLLMHQVVPGEVSPMMLNLGGHS